MNPRTDRSPARRPNPTLGRTCHRAVARAVEPMEARVLMSAYTVNTPSDAADPGTGLLSFRQAVADANAHAGADTIAFAPGLAGGTVSLVSGPIAFTDTTGGTTLTGPAAGRVTVDSHDAGRSFEIGAGATVSMSSIGVTGGEQQAPDAAGDVQGGGIYNAGTLQLTNCSIVGNEIYQSTGPGTAEGGGIYSSGTLTIVSSDLSGNSVNNVNGSQTAGGTGGGGAGGAIYSTGPLTLNGDTIGSNTIDAAGAPDTGQSAGDGGTAAGGGVFAAGPLSVVNCAVTSNRLTAGYGSTAPANGGGAFGGGIFAAGAATVIGSRVNLDDAIAGSPTAGSGRPGAAQGGGIYAGGAIMLTGSTLDQNSVAGGFGRPEAVRTPHGMINIPTAGGGLYAAAGATLATDTIDNNFVFGGPAAPDLPTTAAGGGVYIVGPLDMTDSTVSTNSITGASNGTTTGAGTAAGGGVAVLAPSTITGSTLDHDSATGGIGYGGAAGGTGIGGGLYASAAVTVTNSTVVDDTATGGAGSTNQGGRGASGGPAMGGGLYVTAGLMLADSTVSGNATIAGQTTGGKPKAQATAGGLGAAGGTVTLTNSAVSADTAGGADEDVAGTLGPGSAFDLIGVGGNLTNGTRGNRVGVTNPKLGGLASNGGPTQTELPLPGSPLLDAGSTALVPAGLTLDQRRLARVSGRSADIGSVEVAQTATAAISGTVIASGKPLAGATVYLDLNDDGQLDAGDASFVTGQAGTYAFAGRPAGSYAVRQVAPSGYAGVSPAGDQYTIVLTPGQRVTTATFADASTVGTAGTITGLVFNDANEDGKQDNGEGGKAGVTVFLDLAGTGTPVAGDPTTVSNGAGAFTFTNVVAGTVLVRTEVPVAENYYQSYPANDEGQSVQVVAGRTTAGIAFGEVTLGGF